MEAKLGFNGYSGFQVVFSKSISQTESQDSVVPDTLPDIASILCTSGCILIRSKDVSEGHVRLEANVPARVCCAGEGDGQPYCLDVNLPFYISAEEETIRDGSVCTAKLTIKHLEARMLNPRKISVRAEIAAQLKCCLEEDVTFCTEPAEQDAVIHTLVREAELSAIRCVTEKTFVLTDEYERPHDRQPAAEIAAQNAEVLFQEIRSVGTKLILKGSVRSDLICVSENGEMETVSFATPFSQVIETQTETENALCEATVLLSGMYYELTPDTDGRSISAEFHLVAQITVFQRQRMRYLADAYSNLYPLTIRRQQTEAVLYDREVALRETFNAAIELPGEVRSIVSSIVTPVAWSEDDGVITVQLLARLCWRGGSEICSAERTLTQRIPADPERGSLIVYAASVQDLYASPASGGAEMRITTEIRAFAVQKAMIERIDGISYEESAQLDLDDRPTVILLCPDPGSDLWTLAKDHCSAIEAICSANDLSGEEVPTDRLLLIPKTV